MRRDLRFFRGRECFPPLGGGDMPEVGSVEVNRSWTINELSELVREAMGLTYDHE